MRVPKFTNNLRFNRTQISDANDLMTCDLRAFYKKYRIGDDGKRIVNNIIVSNEIP